MRFGRTLEKTIYEPWKDQYIDYGKLKKLLREDRSEDDDQEWTEEDEGKFVEELVNVQLEKVNAFQSQTYNGLQERVGKCEEKLEKSVAAEEGNDEGKKSIDRELLENVSKELDEVTKEISELEKFSRVNYTGFLKAAKKHDRRRGSNYRVRPLLQVRLASLPFNSEDYSPLLYRLSAMYSFVRQKLDGTKERSQSLPESKNEGDKYRSYKFWIHQDNLLEVKTYILRRLPVLVYNPQSAKNAESGQLDPSMTSLYFDNSQFSLYTQKIEKTSDASSLRLRWYGPLADKPEVTFEKKTVHDHDSEVTRFPIKEKYIQSFITGDNKMEKKVEKLRGRDGDDASRHSDLKSGIEEVQKFIQENKVRPVLRANYNRTAFQIPGDDRLRISIDTDLALIREDSLDSDRPCRDPNEWHRNDIDRLGIRYPFSEIRQGEISRFPHAVLEIKVKGKPSKRANEWIDELMSSHLVKEAPKFSKFVHGVASLFDDYVNVFPFWLSDLETDIRKDPETAFQEEQEKKAKQVEDELAVGSFMGSKSASSFQKAVGSPAGKQSSIQDKTRVTDRGSDLSPKPAPADEELNGSSSNRGLVSGLLSLTPFSNTRYGRARRGQPVVLPPGVQKPSILIKDMNPVKVEPKVWLANQRTFVKWQHVSVLLATLALALYNAAGKGNNVARGLAVVYTAIALFTGAWGWWIYLVRSRMIEERSGKDFDKVLGPTVVCIGLIIGLIVNFAFKFDAVMNPSDRPRKSQAVIMEAYTELR